MHILQLRAVRKNTHRQTGRQADRQAGRQTERQRDRETDREKYKTDNTDRHDHKQTRHTRVTPEQAGGRGIRVSDLNKSR